MTRTQPQEIISELESDNSRLVKEEIVSRAVDEGLDEFFEGARLALDKSITFGVKQVPVKPTTATGQGLPWSAFKDLANKLAARELTGNDARNAINLQMNVATVDQWNGFYRRILIKDLRCGVSESTINKVVKKKKRLDLSISVFECQLAHDGADHESKICGRKMIEVKLDGVRVLTIARKNGVVEQFSRNGKQLVNFKVIVSQFESVFKQAPLQEDMVFDGEVMSASFQDLMGQLRRKSNVQADDSILHLFDIIPLKEFNAGKWNYKQSERTTRLKAFYDEHQEILQNVSILNHDIVDLDTPGGRSRFNEINQAAIKGGYEGIMIKDLDAPYECKRTVNWLKKKPTISVTLKVDRVVEGTGKNIGRMGALDCSGYDLGHNIQSSVGSGYSDILRQQIWDDPDSVLGQMIEVEADALTLADGATIHSLRFPRFKIFRGFAKGEKI